MGITETSEVWTYSYWEIDGPAGIEQVDFSAPSDSQGSKSGAIAEFSLDDPITEPGPGLGYAASYASTVTVDNSETITFYLAAAGDANLIINGQNVLALRCENIEGAKDGPCPANGAPICLCSADSPFEQGSVTIELGAGTHTIEVGHFDHATGKGIVLDWAVGDLVRQPMDLEVPTEAGKPLKDRDGGGEWSGVFDWPLIGIHAIMTPDNKVLTYGTDEKGRQGGHVIYDVWDPLTGEHTTLENKTETDLFCSVPILVPSTGEILISGGDGRLLGNTNKGVNDVNVYDYEDMSLKPSPTGDMAYQRWYPTAVTLANGKILMVGGLDADGNGVGMPELYTPGVGWKSLTGAFSENIATNWWYPRTWLNSDGKVVMFGTDKPGAYRLFVVDPSGDGSIESAGRLPFVAHKGLPAVMFEKNKVLILGTDGSAWVMDISGDEPTFTRTANVNAGSDDRIWSNLVVLADGSVMVSGGSAQDNQLVGVSNDVGIWNPKTGKWKWGDDADVARLYHSTTILLPDATVLSLGGGAPGPLKNTNGEIYTPPYLFDKNGNLAERPTIIDAPDEIAQRETFKITVDDADSIDRLTLVKAGSVTHALNMSTTKLELNFTVGAGNTLEITPPGNANVLSPGQWMLFAFNSEGTPSIAATIQVGVGGEKYLDGIDGYVTLNGAAFYNKKTDIVSLTQPETKQVGGVMSNEQLDLSEDFDISFRIHLGENDANGGDGMAFVLHNARFGADAVGGIGGGLGAFGIKKGLALEFDTYKNGSRDVGQDHAAWTNTDTRETASGTSLLKLGNIEDGKWHAVSVSWDASAQTLDYVFDGKQGATLSGDIANTYFGGSELVYFGFTAATGGYTNRHLVRKIELQTTPSDPNDNGGNDPPDPPVDPDLVFVSLNGSASYNENKDIFKLTKKEVKQAGSVMSDDRLDLSEDFDISFSVYLGTENAEGADGMAFVLHNDPFGSDAIGSRGGGLGAFGIESGLALEFDTYKNGSRDIGKDHAAWTDTATRETVSGTSLLKLGNIEDGKWHAVSVSWDASAQTLDYVFDGKQGATLSGDIASAYFGGSELVYFGFTGATGGYVNSQKVREIELEATFEDGTEVAVGSEFALV